MRIGFDVRLLGTGRLGISRSIIGLTHGLSRLNSSEEFVCFTSGREENSLPGGNRFSRVRVVSPLPVLLSTLLGFARHVNRQKLDLFHSPYPLLPWKINCKSIVTLPDLQVILIPRLRGQAGWYSSLRPPPLQKCLDLFYRMTYCHSLHRAERIICISNDARHQLLGVWPELSNKARVIYLGVDEIFRSAQDQNQLDAVRQKYHLPGRYIFYTGTTIPHKNLPRLLAAVSLLSRQGPEFKDLRLVLAGYEHPRYPSLKDMIRLAGAEDITRVLGLVPHDDLPFLYQLADMVVLVSFFEGFGLPALEAMACGTPVVASNNSSLPEIVGKGGLFVDPKNIEDIARAISQLWRDESLRKNLSQKSIQHARKFSWKRTAEETLAVYKEILDPDYLRKIKIR